MYSDTPKHMHPATRRSVLAAMANLLKKGRVFCEEGEGIEASTNWFYIIRSVRTQPLALWRPTASESQ